MQPAIIWSQHEVESTSRNSNGAWWYDVRFCHIIETFGYGSMHKWNLEDGIHVYTDEKEFLDVVRSQIRDIMELAGENEDLDLSTLHSDPEIQKKLQARTPRARTLNDMSYQELTKSKYWKHYPQDWTIIYKF
jgi:hypothetical protein